METKKLFVGGIPWSYDWQELKDAFKEYWEISFARVIKDRETKKSRWFWFIEFVNLEDAVKAKEALDWTELEGKTIKVDFAEDKPREDRAPRD
jgi:RNA recognition motif-containing protein